VPLSLYHKAQTYFQSFIHLFFPHLCLECGTDLLSGFTVLCTHCENNLPYTDLFSIQNNKIEKIFWGRVPLNAASAVLFFTKDSIVQTLIFELKYHQNKKAGWLLGRLIGACILASPRFYPIDFLVPIPISKKKQRQRGFNQAMIICEGILQILPTLKILPALKKQKSSRSQTHKDRIQRGDQMAQLFELDMSFDLGAAKLLIVDDVITTGATLEAACACLWQAQPKAISIAAATYTL
jgi:ComF family protein